MLTNHITHPVHPAHPMSLDTFGLFIAISLPNLVSALSVYQAAYLSGMLDDDGFDHQASMTRSMLSTTVVWC